MVRLRRECPSLQVLAIAEQPAAAACYGQRGESFPPAASYVALGSQDRYFIRFTNGLSECVGPEGLHEQIQLYDRAPGKEIRSLAFGATWDSWFIVYEDGTAALGGTMPNGLTDLLNSTKDSCRGLERVALGLCGQWYLADLDGEAWWELEEENGLRQRKQRWKISDSVWFDRKQTGNSKVGDALNCSGAGCSDHSRVWPTPPLPLLPPPLPPLLPPPLPASLPSHLPPAQFCRTTTRPSRP